MKKVTAFVMAILMAATLFACSTNVGTDSSSSPAGTSPAASSPDSQSSPSQGSESSPSASAPASDLAKNATVDFQYTTDPFSRETYKIAYIIQFQSPYTSAMCEQYELLSQKLNYDFSSFEAGGDTDKFMTITETAAGQDYDGMIIEGDTTTYERIFEIMADYPEVKFVPGLSPFDDTKGKYQWPSVVVASYDRGAAAMQYAIDNYQKYTNTGFDMKDIGFITIQWSVITDFNRRVNGALDKYTALFPDLAATNYFPVDTVAESVPITAEAGLNQVTPIIASNPQMKGWIIYGAVEDYGDGASRALEIAGLDKVSIVVSDSAAMLIRKWETGYNGCWVAGVDTPQVQWADGLVCGLLQLLDGTKTPATLWEDMRGQGQDYTVIKLPYTTVDKSNMAEYSQFANTYLETQYPG